MQTQNDYTKPLASRLLPCRAVGFSLIEMLMALLVASLLMAALAPVMTRKIGDNVNVSGVGTYERLDYAKAYYENKEWAVPAGVNIIKVTAVGGGGAGGSATYGYKKFTYTGGVQNFTIPNGVTKIRVYAIAGGGGGSSGGDGLSTAYGNIPAIPANTEGVITTAGSYSFTNGITPPDTYKAPALNQNCKNSGTTNWTLVSDDSTQVTPGVKIGKIGVKGWVNVNISKVTACGAGGGGSGSTGGAGGSGGYIANKALNVTASANNLILRVGSGGGAGSYAYAVGTVGKAAGGTGGSDGTSRAPSGSTGSCGSASGSGLSNVGGGGGGGATTLLNSSTRIFQIGGGGGGGGGVAVGTQGPGVACAGGMGGNGYGTGAGCAGGGGYTAGNSWYASGGGGGGGGSSSSNCTAGNNATEGARGAGGTSGGGSGWQYYSSSGVCTESSQAPSSASSVGGTGGGFYTSGCSKFAGGGGGGGGLGGRGGRGGNSNLMAAGGVVPNCIFSSSTNCSGGNTGSAGKPGAIKVWYSAEGNTNALKCQYYTTTNAGSGGGAGQIWLGEVNVTPGEVLSVNIGKGGNGATSRSANGSSGGNTVISGSKAGSIITLIGGNGGIYSASGSTGGVSGGCSMQKPWKNWTGLSVFNNQTNLSTLGNGAGGGKAADNNFTGGKGGQTYSIENTVFEGGNGGAGNNNGNTPAALAYGTGGGGGGGNASVTVNTAGLGGNGGNGYVYIEWGEGSGGGGQSGEVVIDSNVWVSGGVSKVKMIIGKGGAPAQETSVNWSGLLGKKGGRGEDTIVMVDDEVVLTAKGGYGGNGGATSNGRGGGRDSAAETMKNAMPGENGTKDQGGAGASLVQSIFPLLGTVDKITSSGGFGGSISTSGEGKAGSGYGAGGGGGMFLNNRAYQGGRGANGMVYIEYKN